MKYKCKMEFYFDSDVITSFGMRVLIDIPYKNWFGKEKIKIKYAFSTIKNRSRQSYNDFLKECVDCVKEEGFKEKMINEATELVKEKFGVSEYDIEQRDLINQMNSLLKGLQGKEFEVEI